MLTVDNGIQQANEHKMPAIIHGRICSRNLSGVVQSVNYYGIERMKADDGLCTIALGLVDSIEKQLELEDDEEEQEEGIGVMPTIDESTNLWIYEKSEAEKMDHCCYLETRFVFDIFVQ
ncbi:MAG: hypothetical protein EZS28_023167 [Streblomastix strix]|uniref:Uncharacterized protein n=1 Tax=Streblomastix strix TaxID=222440 RepID=A0A5J4VG63_9EUKA|nr:MAG: hypothetical protein EZS28_023167 [Streblomastix strix]